MTKKFPIFLVFTLVALATFLGGYLISRRSAGNLDQRALIDNSLVDRFDKSPEKRAPQKGLITLSRDEAAFPTLSADGKAIFYYVPLTGEIRSTATQNMPNGSSLVARIQPNAQQILWANNKTLIASYSSGNIYYDLNSNTSRKIDPQFINPTISKSGNRIAFTVFDSKSEQGNISVSDQNMEVRKDIMPTRISNWRPSWINGSVLSLLRPPLNQNPTTALYTLDIQTGNFQNVTELKDGLEILWSPSGQKLVYSYNDEKGNPWLYFMDMSVRDEMGMDQPTKASKCTWSIDNKTLYCAGKNSFISIDTSSQGFTTREIPNPREGINSAAAAINLFLTSSEDYILFKDSQSGKLYGISIN